jgi:molecular chaperone HtpG
MAEIGKYILENLTIAMYKDSQVIYREYVQNSCDSIHKAIQNGLISAREARIDITINDRVRSIEITDNGTGILSASFTKTLSDIANSDKIRGEDKGFRGIGRLCGLAYCNEMQFISSVSGEKTKSIMTWDAKTMRVLLKDNKKRPVQEVLDAILSVDLSQPEDVSTHYFKVVLKDIISSNDDLLKENDIISYLSFIAPVPYNSSFMFTDKIYKHARELRLSIDEYKVYVNNSQVFKEYKSNIYSKEGRKVDEVVDIAFQEFYDDSNEMLAWMWYGISAYNGAIQTSEYNPHKGLRLRQSNIEIGDEDTLRKLHKEPHRGNSYFIGEVFAIHKELTPNSQRDYFSESFALTAFESALKIYFRDILYRLYYTASNERGNYKAITEYKNAEQAYQKKVSQGFATTSERDDLEFALDEKREQAKKAAKAIEKTKKRLDEETTDVKHGLLIKVSQNVQRAEEAKGEVASLSLDNTERADLEKTSYKDKPKYLTDDLSQFDRKVRRIVGHIYEVIADNASPEVAQRLIEKINEALKQKR